MVHPKVLVLRTAGTNCDVETAFAFESSGAHVERVHINRLVSGEKKLENYQILALAGGFSYGDDIISGRILANELRLRLGEEIKRFIADGKLIIGICNGFQVLVRAGILPGTFFQRVPRVAGLALPLRDPAFLNSFGKARELPFASPAVEQIVFSQTVTLTHNDSGKFEDRWIYLKPDGHCVWTQGLNEVIYLPVAHAEGKFVALDENVLSRLKDSGQVIFRYCDENGDTPVYPANPNGAIDNIAGITDATGRILGLMPHPERHFLSLQHPSWTRLASREKFGQGAKIFENGVQYIKKNLI